MSTISKFAIIISLVVAMISPMVAQEIVKEPSRSDLRPWEGELYAESIDVWSVVGDGHYLSEYSVPAKWYDREIILRLGYVERPYRLLINGKTSVECDNGSIRCDYNLTKVSREGLNSVEIILKPNSAIDSIESWRGGVDSVSADPIRRAEILAPARMTLHDICSEMTLLDGGRGVRCDIALPMKSYSLNDRSSMVSYRLTSPDGDVLLNGEESVRLGMLGCDTLRISTVVNDGLLWSGESATLCRLDVKVDYSGWSVEEHSRFLGVRSVECDEEGEIYINGKRVTLVASVVDGTIDEEGIRGLQITGVNTLLLSAGVDAESIMDLCDRMGVYVIYTAPIDSSIAGDAITLGGNPSNAPEWREHYLRRVEDSYHTISHHPSVVAYALAERSANGCNLYECYLRMKALVGDRPIIYRDCRGEWNSDKLKLVIF